MAIHTGAIDHDKVMALIGQAVGELGHVYPVRAEPHADPLQPITRAAPRLQRFDHLAHHDHASVDEKKRQRSDDHADTQERDGQANQTSERRVTGAFA